MTRRYIERSDGRIQRYNIKGKGFAKRYENTGSKKDGKNIYKKIQKQSQKIVSGIKKVFRKKKIYRSLIMLGEYSNRTKTGQSQEIDVRIEIHTKKPRIEESELYQQLSEFLAFFNIPNNALQERGLEINTEIEQDEMNVDELDVWFGEAHFNVDRANGTKYDKAYKGKNTGSGWVNL